jgi:hypothetical protein
MKKRFAGEVDTDILFDYGFFTPGCPGGRPRGYAASADEHPFARAAFGR